VNLKKAVFFGLHMKEEEEEEGRGRKSLRFWVLKMLGLEIWTTVICVVPAFFMTEREREGEIFVGLNSGL
jgi:hypothetical protein